MDPAHNYWPINPNDHHHLLSSSSLQPQAQFGLQTHVDMNTTSISDHQLVSLKYSYSSLESSPPPAFASHYSYNHCFDSLSSPNYASCIPSSAVHNLGLAAPFSDYNQGSSIQLIGHELETDSIPGCPIAPSPRPPEEQQKSYSYGHTQEYPSAQLVSLITPPICPDSFVDINSPASLITYSSSDKHGIALQQKEAAAAAAAARQHMIAERKRRQRQSESFKALLTVVPSIIKKADKVTILDRTVQHIKQLQDRVDELQQHKHALLMQAATEPAMINTTGVMGGQQFLSTPTHADGALEEPLTSSQTSQSVSSPETHSDIVVTSQVGGQPPLFHIKMNVTVQPTEANDTIIKAISGLKDKKLHCIHVKSEYSAENSHLSAKILAKFKDGENSTPSADEVMEIKEWWRQLRLTFFTRGREEP